MEDNNKVLLVGTVDGNFVLDHEVYGEKFFKTFVNSKRASEVFDRIPILVSEKILDSSVDYDGLTVYVTGELRSFNAIDRRLCLNVFANSLEVVDESTEHINTIYLDGFTCKKPYYRTTPKGRLITELTLAINRRFGKSDYLPCITWGRNASLMSKIDVGTRIVAEGRIQSREYQKALEETVETRVAYEVSISWLQIVGE